MFPPTTTTTTITTTINHNSPQFQIKMDPKQPVFCLLYFVLHFLYSLLENLWGTVKTLKKYWMSTRFDLSRPDLTSRKYAKVPRHVALIAGSSLVDAEALAALIGRLFQVKVEEISIFASNSRSGKDEILREISKLNLKCRVKVRERDRESERESDESEGEDDVNRPENDEMKVKGMENDEHELENDDNFPPKIENDGIKLENDEHELKNDEYDRNMTENDDDFPPKIENENSGPNSKENDHLRQRKNDKINENDEKMMRIYEKMSRNQNYLPKGTEDDLTPYPKGTLTLTFLDLRDGREDIARSAEVMAINLKEQREQLKECDFKFEKVKERHFEFEKLSLKEKQKKIRLKITKKNQPINLHSKIGLYPNSENRKNSKIQKNLKSTQTPKLKPTKFTPTTTPTPKLNPTKYLNNPLTSDPDLILSLGGKNSYIGLCTTLGYPPLNVGGAEIHCLGLYEDVIGLECVMAAYADCQQRWGK